MREVFNRALKRKLQHLHPGQAVLVAQRRLLADLVALHYKRNDGNFVRGTFRVRGDTVEVFPSHLEDRAWRVSLFGDEIEGIVEFDPLTGHKTAEEYGRLRA